jgi:superfamily II RNA helicase
MVLITDNNNYPNNSKYEEYFKLFQYDLSPFQKHAIQGIVDGNHVLVTAATGSGKTLPAEFAIRHFTSIGKRVIYCSPIKALSNQKTFDFTQKYPDITFGLLTGDIKTNPTAQVLIMTTEILMNRLFTQTENKSESSLTFNMDIENELGCVIFDELHYINDAHRGHVWEQSILMLPAHVQMVMLSATLDDPVKFANWVEARECDSEARECDQDKDQDKDALVQNPTKQVIICSTDTRVVPLTHYVYMNTPEGLFKKIKDKETESIVRKTTNKCLPIRSADGVFNESTYRETKNVIQLMEKHQIYQNRKPVLNSLLSHLKTNDMLPAICFVFSRKAVEQCAEEITVPLLEDDSKISYTVKNECQSIIRKLPNWREYEELYEYQVLVKLLEKGIGIHHSGMIPVLREIVEFMISKKYIKVLFATESFAIGLDCPIKTAVFVNLKKYDGSDKFRYLLSHEYTQMAGRAGRRGIDTVGHVVHCSNLFDLPEVSTYKEILCGKPQTLVSKFKIYYPVVLNMFKTSPKIKTTEIESFVKQSMYQCEIDKISSGLKREVDILSQKLDEKTKDLITPLDVLATYHTLLDKLKFSANKKKKEIGGQIHTITSEHKNLEKDYCHYYECLKVEKALHEAHESLTYNEEYIGTKVNSLAQIMLEADIIETVGDEYALTQTGASSVSEINPVLIAILCKKWNYFEGFKPHHLVAFLSLFADVRVDQETRVYAEFENYCKDEFMNEKINSFEKIRFDIIMLEEKYGIFIKDAGLDDFCYDLVDLMIHWCYCENETECKTLIANREISVGDFTKAILKISTLSRELIGMCETIGQTELKHNLSLIDGMILKYVATSQSLYL